MPLTYVHAGAPPMLLIHGNADKTVPISQSHKLADALKKAGAKNVTFLIVDGAGHNAFVAGDSATRGG
jgi:dipeptidyl aminopeptidase/acylaminoacyl peptidase